MKTKSLLLLCVLGVLCVSSPLRAADNVERSTPESFFAKGTWAVSPFASYRVHEFGAADGKFGGGLALSYFAADNLAVELETVSEHFDDSHWADSFTEAGVNAKGYLPLGATGFAPYLLVGYTRAGLDGVSPHQNGATESRATGQNRMNAGAGIEWRATKRFGVFADGRWTHDFDTLGHALFRVGGNLSF